MLGIVLGHPLDTVKVKFFHLLIMKNRQECKWRRRQKYGIDNWCHWWNVISKYFKLQSLGLFIYVPMEVLKCNAQVNAQNFKGYREFIPDLLKKQGPFGFYKGYWATFWRDVPGWAIYFYSYEAQKQFFQKNYLEKIIQKEGKSASYRRDEFLIRLFCGGMAGVFSWLLCFPFDVVKTQIQVNILSEQPVEMRMSRIIKQIYTEKGIRHFYIGMGANLIRTFPVDAVILASFDYLNEWLDGYQ
ncbi:UNKNOWN [Stylonychia lemnae]|uniref:Mitochondrial carrier protein n=1 Tax=Stylonychia lemnae TaxID=5949 RepID=A0A078ALY8_STYLE|nr:UNKNOWN [Stylonychia lemnae]|eukprot:CDW82871.1 UNKNOWN [Stylonychia lemnae]